MITFEEAIVLLKKNPLETGVDEIAIENALYKIVAEDVFSPFNHPFFDQSAVDGYAFKYEDIKKTLKLKGEIPAGQKLKNHLETGKAARIFTGAPIPEGADTIAMQEIVTYHEKGKKVQFPPEKIKKGDHIRKAGAQIKSGDIAIQKNTKLNPTSIGFLATLGIQKIKVYRTPKVEILVTGSEFTEDENDLAKGKIFQSNGTMLQKALTANGISSNFSICKDDLDILKKEISQSTEKNNLLILTGGVSVGDYDFTREALEACDYSVIFHKVAQKPGKPILFAKHKNGALAFGLPGNPRAVMVCFYMYILPLIQKETNSLSTYIKLPIGHKFTRKNDQKTYFFSASILHDGTVNIKNKQASHMLQSLAEANAIAILKPDKIAYEKGELISIKLLSY